MHISYFNEVRHAQYKVSAAVTLDKLSAADVIVRKKVDFSRVVTRI